MGWASQPVLKCCLIRCNVGILIGVGLLLLLKKYQFGLEDRIHIFI